MLKVNNPINSPGLLRFSGKEFCLKSRSECLYFRGQLTNLTVKAPSIPEIVRKIESEQHKYSKLLMSSLIRCSVTRIGTAEADIVMVFALGVCRKSAEVTVYFTVTAILLRI